MIKLIVKSLRQKRSRFLYRRPQVVLAFAAILTVSGAILFVPFVRDYMMGLVMILSFGAAVYAMRHFARSADDVIKRSGTPPIVLFRSFDDEKALRIKSFFSHLLQGKESFERTAGRVLRQFGPFVAIGKPGEGTPPLGAARGYVDEETWRARALDFIRCSKLVVMLAGSTEGLRWELERIIDEKHHDKLLILIPPLDNSQRCERLRDLAKSFAGTLWHDALSQAVGDDAISVQLGPDGLVILVTAPGYQGNAVFARHALYVALYGLWRDWLPGPRQSGRMLPTSRQV